MIGILTSIGLGCGMFCQQGVHNEENADFLKTAIALAPSLSGAEVKGVATRHSGGFQR